MAIVLRQVTSDAPQVAEAPEAQKGVRCSLCGCASVNLDYWDDPDGEASMQLGQCPRCDHRWTTPLAVQQRPLPSPVSPELPGSSESCPGLPAAA